MDFIYQINNSYKSLNIANKITVLRLFLAVPLLFLLSSGKTSLAWFLIIIGGITDILDGYIARKYSKSVLGEKLDPLADKVFVLAPILWLIRANLIPLWSAWLIISRDLIISNWRGEHSSGFAASKAAKIKTITQFVSILLMLWPKYIFGTAFSLAIYNIGYILFLISILISVISGANYVFKGKINQNQV